MNRNESGRQDILNAFVVGFALFASFFGAGNLIFPPLLGQLTGLRWWLGFLAFLAADALLAVVVVLAAARKGVGVEEQMGKLGKWPARLVCLSMMLCIGPLVVVPRTAATTYEMSVRPLLGDLNPWLFSFIFFAIVALLTIRPAAVVDVIGKYLTPVLLALLAILCIKGVITPIGRISELDAGVSPVRLGISFGYQTMDALMAIPVTMIIFKSLSSKGYKEPEKRFRIITYSCLVAFAGLFVVYGGLTFLGATTSSLELGGLTGTDLLVEITRRLLDRTGIILLGAVVFLACLTTAIGVTSAVADYLEELIKKRIPYSVIVLILCAAGVLVSNLGTEQIISLAEPALEFLYPVFLTQMLLSFFEKRIGNPWVFRGAAIGAALFSLLTVLDAQSVLSLPFLYEIPLSSLGLGWLLPAAAGALLGALIPRRSGISGEKTEIKNHEEI